MFVSYSFVQRGDCTEICDLPFICLGLWWRIHVLPAVRCLNVPSKLMRITTGVRNGNYDYATKDHLSWVETSSPEIEQSSPLEYSFNVSANIVQR
jgi:hypothetical protein